MKFKDMFGNNVKTGDFVVYTVKRYGVKMKVGKVLGVTSFKDEYDGKRYPLLRVWGAEEGYPNFRSSTLSMRERVAKVPKTNVNKKTVDVLENAISGV